MKLILLIPLLAFLVSCEEKSGLITVYDEVHNFSSTRERPVTGAKVILLENVKKYSTVKVISLQGGEMTELSSEQLEESKKGSYAYSLRLYTNQEGIPTWIYRYRGTEGTGTSSPLHSETMEGDWQIYCSGGKYGSLKEETEVLDAFVLFQDHKDFHQNPTTGGFDAFAPLADQQAFSKKHPKIRIILLTLE